MNDENLTPYDAFPNAPGLSEDLGLQQRPDGKLPPRYNPEGHRWYSICSKHHDGKEGCPLCAVGSYHSDPRTNRSAANTEGEGT